MSLFPRVGRQQTGLRIAWYTMVTFLVLGILLHLFPFYYMLVTSITPAQEAMGLRPSFWPQNPTFAAWQLIWEATTKNSTNAAARAMLEHPYSVYFLNSLFIAAATMLFSLPITSLAAYAVSKLLRGPAARWAFLFFIGTLFLPGMVTLTANYLLVLNFPFPVPKVPNIPGTETAFPTMRLYNTPWAVIIPGLFGAYNFLLFKGYFDTIPDSIIQAARVDGGSEMNIFRRIVLPMSVPVYAVAAWTMFGGVWESFLWPKLVLADNEKQTAAVAIYEIMQKFNTEGTTDQARIQQQAESMREMLAAGLSWNGLMVLGILQTVPIFIMFMICREYLMKGIKIRGLK
ncbi:MAG: carbohydrate ABC transporter permease [Roseiflexaceae bacterium]|nr:carbohydrate ABC transporter permease [Roseiflexaceae bacterium]